MNLIAAQDAYIETCLTGHPGHAARRANAAARKLHAWAISKGYTADEAKQIVQDARDVRNLQRNADD
jgi:hypothetical protein